MGRKANTLSRKKTCHGSELKDVKSKRVSMPVNTLMPGRYNSSKRAQLREFEKAITEGVR